MQRSHTNRDFIDNFGAKRLCWMKMSGFVFWGWKWMRVNRKSLKRLIFPIKCFDVKCENEWEEIKANVDTSGKKVVDLKALILFYNFNESQQRSI